MKASGISAGFETQAVLDRGDWGVLPQEYLCEMITGAVQLGNRVGRRCGPTPTARLRHRSRAFVSIAIQPRIQDIFYDVPNKMTGELALLFRPRSDFGSLQETACPGATA